MVTIRVSLAAPKPLSSAAQLFFLICAVQTMTWDDHDIFDGWGSYPDGLQNCPVFQGCYQAARRFYLLFQQHTTLQRIGETDMFGHRCVRMFDPPKLGHL